jgi:hypothetical protein
VPLGSVLDLSGSPPIARERVIVASARRSLLAGEPNAVGLALVLVRLDLLDDPRISVRENLVVD